MTPLLGLKKLPYAGWCAFFYHDFILFFDFPFLCNLDRIWMRLTYLIKIISLNLRYFR